MREYEIGSEAWMRERIERGLDPSEGDQPEDDWFLRVQVELAGPADPRAEAYPAWSTWDLRRQVVF